MTKQNPSRSTNARPRFQRKLLAASIASCVVSGFCGTAIAQEEVIKLEEVVVTGHRYAQATAINVKRDSAVVMDALAADGIGKLPDITIADSLQRIPGIQIRRSAGEGTEVSLRGLPQVATKLNGESYLGAGSITTVQPSFSDLPAQLFKGADVYKTSSANQVTAGITGTINLKTYRPFDFAEGMTAAGNVEAQQGTETKETDPAGSGMFSWRNERVGVLVSAAYSNPNLANYYNGFNTGEAHGDSGWVNGINDWGGGQQYNVASPQGVVAWNQVTERERLGFNAAFQADLGEGFEFVAEVFYTDQEEYNRKVGLSATNKWQGLEYFSPSQLRPTGDFGGANGAEWAAVQQMDIEARRVKSFTQNDSYLSDSTNVNLELNYDNGGPITGSVRYVSGSASSQKRHGYNEGDLTDGSATGLNAFYPAEFCGDNSPVGDQGGCFVGTNPQGYSDIPNLTYNTSGSHPRWGGFDNAVVGGLPAGTTLREYMANQGSYNVGAFSSENNGNSEADLDVFRADGSYQFNEGGFFTSVDVGVRLSDRSVDEEKYHLFSPFYNEGCGAQWKATDVVLNTGDCQAGEMVGGEFQGYTVLPPTALDAHNNVSFVTDFGPVSGIPGIWAADPADYDDPEAFHNSVFGSTQKVTVPGKTYNVDLKETTYYVQGNFEYSMMTGNVGLRMIDSEMVVKQNIAGAGIPYGNSNVDDGDIVTRVDNTEYLPSLNLAFAVRDDVTVRFAYAKNATPLDLNLWGDGLSVETSLDQDLGFFVVNAASLGGNPELEQWKSDNYDVSAEWYIGDASMLSVAAFYIDIESFVQSGTIPMQFADPDGVVRRTINVDTQVQGKGGTIEGVELAARIALSDFTDGFMSGFGVDANYTYSPGEQDAKDISGDNLPFPENSEDQVNVVLWYEQGPFQARVAYNYRSERLAETGRTSGNLAVYQDEVAYVDLSASYDITAAFTVYVSGSNVTESYEDYYMQWSDQYAYQNYYEPRYTLGLRAKF